MIKVENLKKSYDKKIAVDNISFEITKGETFGLLGPNGAGKTTTILLLAGVLKSDGGAIDINGNGNPTHAEQRKQIGIAPQTLSLYDALTGEENVRFFASLYGLKDLSDRTTKALEFVGLADRRNDLIRTYSGGMKRRINLACAIVHDPSILFLDEPTVGVDPQSRNHIFENIEKLKAQGKTVVYTTHYMEEAQRLCNRAAIMDYGKILAIGTPEELVNKHGGESILTVDLDRPPQDLQVFPGKLEELTLRIDTARPLDDLAKISSIAQKTGVKLLKVKIDRPDLESVFLNLTGRSLRD